MDDGLTDAERDTLRRYVDRQRARVGSPLVSLLTGIGIMTGLAASGPVAAAVCGVATFCFAVWVVDSALRRV